MKKILLLVALITLCSFNDPLKKIISDKQYRYEFFTTPKKVSPRDKHNYHWFRGGALHNSEAGIGGEVLTGPFLKYFLSNQLAESGTFVNGCKEGVWKNWHSNGKLSSQQIYQNGLRHGKYYGYDTEGNLTEKGNFRLDKKHGKWISLTNKDT